MAYHVGIGMNILNAWLLTTGRGATVGVTDTGLDGSNPQFGALFASGASQGRWLHPTQTIGLSSGQFVEPQRSHPVCSHGTRIAGVAAAPRDGRSAVGVAYGANLYTVYQADGELISSSGWAATAIHLAAEARRFGVSSAEPRVVIMAWGQLSWSDVIANEIRTHHTRTTAPNGDVVRGTDVLFVGAAGTCAFFGHSICNSIAPMSSAVFPASMAEVLAVTGAASDGQRPIKMYDFGTKAGVVAYTNVATTGLDRPELTHLSGSSGATGVVGGIAALVRARNPGMSARQVMDRLISTAGFLCGSPPVWRDALVNASAAAGGACVSRVIGPTDVWLPPYDPYGSETATFFIEPPSGGSGQFAIRWSNGGSGLSADYRIWAPQPGRMPPAGQTPVYPLWVEVRDLVTGTVDYREHRVRIQGWTGEVPNGSSGASRPASSRLQTRSTRVTAVAAYSSPLSAGAR